MTYGYSRISYLDRSENKNGKQLICQKIQESKSLGGEVIMYDMESVLNEKIKRKDYTD